MNRIAAFGCSHTRLTTKVEEERPELLWTRLLENKLNIPIENYAQPGITNENIFRIINRYLLTDNVADTIIVQWTEPLRWNFYKPDRREEEYSLDVKSDPGTYSANWFGRDFVQSLFDRSHITGAPQQELVLYYSYMIKLACEKQGIKAYFVAYDNMMDVEHSPMVEKISDHFLHSNFGRGWHNHVRCVIGEGYSFDGGHFGPAAVDYTSERWYNLLTKKERIAIEEDYYYTKPVVYDYT